MEDAIRKVMDQFARLDQILIDASSIIYCRKTGIWNLLTETLEVQTIREIAEEVGELLNIKIIESLQVELPLMKNS